MSTLREQFSAARKAQVEIQLDLVRNLTSNVVESTGKVLALNLTTGRHSIEQSADTLRKLVTAKSPRDLIDLSSQSASSFDTLLNYGSELFNIASRAQADLIKAAAPAAAPAPGLKALPTAQVEVEVRAQAEPQPAVAVVEEVPVPETAAAKPLAKAVSDSLGEAEAPVLEASPLVTPEAPQLKISGIEPVDAAPPPAPVSGTPVAQDKPETAAPKSRRKK
jgi:phasin family protein